jgi:hypothetical protein
MQQAEANPRRHPEGQIAAPARTNSLLGASISILPALDLFQTRRLGKSTGNITNSLLNRG